MLLQKLRDEFPSAFDHAGPEWDQGFVAAYQDFEAIVAGVRETMPDASDIQFIGGGNVWVHANGADQRTSTQLRNDDLLTWARLFGRSGRGDEDLRDGPEGAVENAIDIAGVRLRMTFRRQMGGYGLNVRILAQHPPALDSPRYQRNPAPQKLVDLILNNTDGIILFEGPTGSGKSTLQASLVAEVNRTQNRHIYTLEDPIEFVHTSERSLVTQRQIGTDVDSFAQGLVTAKRSKPGVILLGELRDRVVMRAAVESAGEGHLVLATSHASDVSSAIASFVGSFSADEQAEVRQRLAGALRAVVVQKLVPTIDGKVVPARELLLVDATIASKIRETSSSEELKRALGESGFKLRSGSYSFDDDLIALAYREIITPETAARYAQVPDEVARKLEARVRTGS